ncbi:GOST seven transmembrane domain-containing protein [Plasmodiophora brassicae]
MWLWLLWASLAAAETFTYEAEPIDRGSLVDFGLSLVAPDDGDNATVTVNVRFDGQPAAAPVPISVAVIGMRPGDLPGIRDALGLKLNGRAHVCCDSDLYESKLCNRPGHLVFNPALVSVYAEDVVDGTAWYTKASVADTRFVMMIVGVCPNADTAFAPMSATMSGTVVVRHPTGMLSPIDYPYVQFYTALSFAYLALGAAWLLMNVRHRTQVMQVQHAISVVLVLCLIESFSWMTYYGTFNRTGDRPMALFAVSLVAGSVRRAVSRMLVVAVSMGFGVSKPSLGRSTNRILAAGALFAVLEALLQLSLHMATVRGAASPSQTTLLLMVPVTLMDAAFYWWTFASLSDTLDDLHTRHQIAKHDIMWSFSALLIAALVVACLFGAFRIYFVEQALQLRYWQFTYLLYDGFPQVLYFAVLLGIAALWRPGPHTRSIAYAEQITDRDVDDEFELDLQVDDDGGDLLVQKARRSRQERFEIGEE